MLISEVVSLNKDVIEEAKEFVYQGFDTMDAITEAISQVCERETIYTSRCYEIVRSITNDFKEAIEEGYTTIDGFAFYYLHQELAESSNYWGLVSTLDIELEREAETDRTILEALKEG